MFNSKLPLGIETLKIASVSIILIGTLVLWLLLGRTARRMRHKFQDLLTSTRAALDDDEKSGEIDVAQRRLTALRLLVNTARYGLLVGAILLLLNQFDINLGSLVFPAGFLGAALGLGAQDLVRDLVAGFFIIFEGQFAVGDRVIINGVAGVVEEVGLRVTKMRDETEQLHFVPNGAINTVARQSRRPLPFVLAVPLADVAQHDEALKLVQQVVQDLDANHAVLDGEMQAEDARGDWLRLRLPMKAGRASLARDRLIGRVNAVLQASEIKTKAGAEVELLAPAEVE